MNNIILKIKVKNMIMNKYGDKYDYQLNNIQINGAKRGCSGFIFNKETKKVVYISTEISWLKPVLIRTAKNNKDYTGGINNFIDVQDIPNWVEKLTKGD